MDERSAGLEIVGRQSSHFTRIVRVFAEEVGLTPAFTPIYDLMSTDAGVFAGNPALKLPILRVDGAPIYGSRNICRVLARRAKETRIVWPEEADTPLLMNAHEIVASALSAEVDIILHELVAKRPPDVASKKRREALVGCLAWTDRHLEQILAELPERHLSLLEVELFCLVSHLPFRNPVDLSAFDRLRAFEERFAQRASAKNTPYRFDTPPA